MNSPPPDPESRSRHSLADRAFAALRGRRERVAELPEVKEVAAKVPAPAQRVAPWLVASLLMCGPLLVWGGAVVARHSVAAETVALERQTAPIRAQALARSTTRAQFGNAVARPTVAVLLDSVAQVLPDDARISEVAQDASGTLEMRIAASDPDRLREALRRDRRLAALRDVEQRRGDGVMIVTFRGKVR